MEEWVIGPKGWVISGFKARLILVNMAKTGLKVTNKIKRLCRSLWWFQNNLLKCGCLGQISLVFLPASLVRECSNSKAFKTRWKQNGILTFSVSGVHPTGEVKSPAIPIWPPKGLKNRWGHRCSLCPDDPYYGPFAQKGTHPCEISGPKGIHPLGPSAQ